LQVCCHCAAKCCRPDMTSGAGAGLQENASLGANLLLTSVCDAGYCGQSAGKIQFIQ